MAINNGCHDHTHSHNRYNFLFNDTKMGASNSATDHHSPLDLGSGGIDLTKNLKHSHQHCHGDSPRAGHDPNSPDILDGSQRPWRYEWFENPPQGSDALPAEPAAESLMDEFLEWLF